MASNKTKRDIAFWGFIGSSVYSVIVPEAIPTALIIGIIFILFFVLKIHEILDP